MTPFRLRHKRDKNTWLIGYGAIKPATSINGYLTTNDISQAAVFHEETPLEWGNDFERVELSTPEQLERAGQPSLFDLGGE